MQRKEESTSCVVYKVFSFQWTRVPAAL